MLTLNAIVRIVFIGEHMAVWQGDPVNMPGQRSGLRVVDNLQTNQSTRASDRTQNRRTIVEISAPATAFVGPPLGQQRFFRSGAKMQTGLASPAAPRPGPHGLRR